MNTKENVCRYIYTVRNCATWCSLGSTADVRLKERFERKKAIVFTNSVRILTFP